MTFGSHKKLWWNCPNGHSWQAAVYARAAGSGCPYCTGRKALRGENTLSVRFPALAGEWDSEKNAPLTPEDVMPGSHRPVWWKCGKGHSYRSAVDTRVQGAGCPYCAGRAVLPEENSLAALYPALAGEWDQVKNGEITPHAVLPGTHRKFWWRCKNGHSWQAAVFSRTQGSTECPFCTGRKVIPGKTDLATAFPELAAQWDWERNGALTPETVSPNANRKVWWRCEKGHSYCAIVAHRTRSHSECPYCTNRKVLAGFHDLATQVPQVAREWHPTLNGALGADMVTPGSHRKVWWQCAYGHVWKAVIYSRAGQKNAGCPICAGNTRRKIGSSFADADASNYNKEKA